MLRPRANAHNATLSKDSAVITVRFLQISDMDALIELENRKWDRNQAASREDLEFRIRRFPRFSIGAFSATGELLASVFMRPMSGQQISAAKNWSECAHSDDEDPQTRSLFGISLSSIDAAAVEEIFAFFWPYALRSGWRDIYLGSPLPGLRSWRRKNPEPDVSAYVYEKRDGLPRDPQLRYYHQKGFREIVAHKPDYFPHEASLDHGAVIRLRIPLIGLSPVLRLLPVGLLAPFRGLLFRFL
ncbi:hypothetical protein [Streptomyces sp. NPDC005805]|uniref:hypothetical protein n=1 Tax=Streptomyces sp. NPDC005805 TaxID=3157068 RepID=UPI0033EA8F93